MELRSLDDLMETTLQELHATERKEIEAAPELMRAVSNPELADAITRHMRETETQLERLERVMRLRGIPPQDKPTKAIDGLFEDNRELMRAPGDPDVKDAGLTCGQQKVEHLEIASYGTAVTFARLLGDEESARLLGETLDEEKRADAMLTRIAESRINPEAAQSA
jgi:ferritin-like metal-binding protein YciE